ncbi:MAG: hypothetical protein ACO3AF_01005 [Flavobacteriales bacterium]
MRRFLCFILWVLLLASGPQLLAQSGSGDPKKENLIERLIETITEQSDAEIDYTEFVEDLNFFYDNPINLNNAKPEDLRKLLLLSELQIQNLATYRRLYGDLLSIYEVPLIKGWDQEILYSIMPFLTVAPVIQKQPLKFKNVLKYGKHELIGRYYDVLEPQQGYITQPGDSMPDYLGPSYQVFTRYRFKYKDRISIGFTAEKDRGEEWFGGSQPQGFDFYSAHLMLKDFGPLKTLVIGDFQTQFGQGLTLWNGIGFRKTAYAMNIKRNAVGIRAYTATNQFTFNRGIAATLNMGFIAKALKNLDASAFASHKPIDGNIGELDTLTGEALEVSSFLLSGMHRTVSELAKKNTIDETVLGGNLTFRGKTFKVGATAVHTQFSTPFSPSDQLYNKYRFAGDRLTNIGMDYDWLVRKLHVFGEFSMSDNGGLAMLHGMQISLHSNLNFSALYRNFSKEYQNLKSNAVSDRFGTQNEEGLYVGFEASPFKKVKVQGYVDLFAYPWVRSNIAYPSKGYEYLVQASFIPNRNFEMYVRFRHQNRPENATGIETGPAEVIHFQRNNYRWNATVRVSKELQLRNRLEWVTVSRPDKPFEMGFMVYQDVIYKPLKLPLDFSGRIGLFSTQGSEARVYAYENDVLYSFTVPGFSGTGMRTYLNIKWEVRSNLTLWLRWSQTYYSDRSVISSGAEEIDGDTRNDLRIQLRYTFRAAGKR